MQYNDAIDKNSRFPKIITHSAVKASWMLAGCIKAIDTQSIFKTSPHLSKSTNKCEI